jgi:drug/metabolite transporter (DMT)-like permease
VTTTATIEARLRAAWRRERRFVHARGGARLAFWVVGLFLLALLLDRLFDLPGWGRPLLSLACLATVAWVAYRAWLRHLRRYDPARVALQVERLHGGLDNLLVSYVQLGGEGAHGSPRLIEAVRQQAGEKAAPLDFRGIVNFRDLCWLLTAAGGVLLLFAASNLFAAQYYLTRRKRGAVATARSAAPRPPAAPA